MTTCNLDLLNPAPRCPVVLILDSSRSMQGAPIQELEAGLLQFINETAHDEAASMSIDLEVIVFGGAPGTKTTTIIPFMPITDVIQTKIQHLRAYGGTFIGTAMTTALADLETRRREYRDHSISGYRPWVIVMSDGKPGDKWQQPARQLRELADHGKIQYLGIAIGDQADLSLFAQMLPDTPGPVRLKGLRFRQFFKWLSDSMVSVSCSSCADQESITLPNPNAWVDGLDAM